MATSHPSIRERVALPLAATAVVLSLAAAAPAVAQPRGGNQKPGSDAIATTLDAYDRHNPTIYQGDVLCGFSFCTWFGVRGLSDDSQYPTAALTTAYSPVAGKIIRFVGPDGRHCEGTTRHDGVAICTWPGWSHEVPGHRANYEAFFDGDDSYRASKDQAWLTNIPAVCLTSYYRPHICTAGPSTP